MLPRLTKWLKGALDFAGDAAHRRAIAVVVMMIVAHFAGRELDIENVDQVLMLVIAGFGAAWTKSDGDSS